MKFKHDKTRKYGFNVAPELLAHDLAMLKLSNTQEFKPDAAEVVYYEAYTKLLYEFTVLLDDKMRYDSTYPSE